MPQINAIRFNDLRGCASVTDALRTEIPFTGTLRTEVPGNVSSAATDSTMAMIVPPRTGLTDRCKTNANEGKSVDAPLTSLS